MLPRKSVAEVAYSEHPILSKLQDIFVFGMILDPRSQRAGSYKIGAVIVNV